MPCHLFSISLLRFAIIFAALPPASDGAYCQLMSLIIISLRHFLRFFRLLMLMPLFAIRCWWCFSLFRHCRAIAWCFRFFALPWCYYYYLLRFIIIAVLLMLLMPLMPYAYAAAAIIFFFFMITLFIIFAFRRFSPCRLIISIAATMPLIIYYLCLMLISPFRLAEADAFALLHARLFSLFAMLWCWPLTMPGAAADAAPRHAVFAISCRLFRSIMLFFFRWLFSPLFGIISFFSFYFIAA